MKSAAFRTTKIYFSPRTHFDADILHTDNQPSFMTAYVFPGQGSQFEGMGKDLHEGSEFARTLFARADALLGFSLSAIMFEGTAEDLRQTKVTQPAIFLHSIITYLTKTAPDGSPTRPDAVAGHSLGEFTALVAAGALSFEDGLTLVYKRAMAMQHACDTNPGTMAAVLGMSDADVERVCAEVVAANPALVVAPANYNCPGQLVVSGSLDGIAAATAALSAAGAKRVLPLSVGGAFHSPLMQSARVELEGAIRSTQFNTPDCPVYQNFDAKPYTDPATIQANLIAQLTAPVRWTQTIEAMDAAGITSYIEVGGTGKVLQGMIKKIVKDSTTAML